MVYLTNGESLKPSSPLVERVASLASRSISLYSFRLLASQSMKFLYFVPNTPWQQKGALNSGGCLVSLTDSKRLFMHSTDMCRLIRSDPSPAAMHFFSFLPRVSFSGSFQPCTARVPAVRLSTFLHLCWTRQLFMRFSEAVLRLNCMFG